MSAEFEALKYVIAVLSANAALIAKLGVQSDGEPAIHTECHADLTDPVYPLITVELLGNPDDRLVQEPEIEINIWCEHAGVEKYEIHDIVRDALILKSGDTSGAWIVGTRKTSTIGNLDDKQAKKYRLLSRYCVSTVEK